MENDDLQRIIFLDIDGPMIPSPCYFVNSKCNIGRTVMSTIAIGCLNNLCKRSGAKIVTNSAHNYHDTNTGNLKEDLIRHGVLEEYFHTDWRTKFPYENTFDDNNGNGFINTTHPRLKGIQEWQHRNGKADWICFDDDPFTNDERLIVVKFDDGITFEYLKKAYKILNVPNYNLVY